MYVYFNKGLFATKNVKPFTARHGKTYLFFCSHFFSGKNFHRSKSIEKRNNLHLFVFFLWGNRSLRFQGLLLSSFLLPYFFLSFFSSFLLKPSGVPSASVGGGKSEVFLLTEIIIRKMWQNQASRRRKMKLFVIRLSSPEVKAVTRHKYLWWGW